MVPSPSITETRKPCVPCSYRTRRRLARSRRPFQSDGGNPSPLDSQSGCKSCSWYHSLTSVAFAVSSPAMSELRSFTCSQNQPAEEDSRCRHVTLDDGRQVESLGLCVKVRGGGGPPLVPSKQLISLELQSVNADD